MLSLDTNIMLPALERVNKDHQAAAAFLESLQHREDVAVSEFILLELYNLLRNPAVLAKPLSEIEAVERCESFRRHPRWQLIGFPSDSRAVHDQLWQQLRVKQFARRRAYDLRTAFSMVREGVTEFATVNVKHFQDVGFVRVWNPLAV